MTEKQRNFIIYLNSLCQEKGVDIRADDSELLGVNWWKDYKNFTPDYTSEVINKLKAALGMPINERKKRR